MIVDVLKSTTKLGVIKFDFLRYRNGPFHSRTYTATLMLDGVAIENEEIYPDYINPLGNVLEDFDLKGGYSITWDSYLEARRCVLNAKNFQIELYQHAIVRECK